MQVSQLSIDNFRGIKSAKLEFYGHSLLVGGNNVGKSTICDALELALGPDRQSRSPVVEEFDFYNAEYLDECENPIEIRIEVLLTDVTKTVARACANHLERWVSNERRVLVQGEIDQVDRDGQVWCLRLLTIARYNKEEDEFQAATHYAKSYNPEDEDDSRVSRTIKRSFGFLYLRALRTGSRALSLERGSLLDIILRTQSLQTGIWEHVRSRLIEFEPPIEQGATHLTAVLRTIEDRLAQYISIAKPGDSTRLFVSQLTREHLRRTLSFFLSVTDDQAPVPFQNVGTGTLNILVLALLSFIAELKQENVIFAMEEPEIALAPHTQRRVSSYLLTNTTQCFVTSHSPYVIENFDPDCILVLRRDEFASVTGTRVALGTRMKAKTFHRHIRRALAEAMLGRGVIVAEGITEQLVLRVAAEKLESARDGRYPLDLSGVTIITSDGDSSIPEFGRFFSSLDVPTFAFYDHRVRSPKDQEALEHAGFQILNETIYAGMEDLLVAEVPVDRQWEYLERVRDRAIGPSITIPAARPGDSRMRELVRQVLKGGKGWGRAADLIEHCTVDELPASIVDFLQCIFASFPNPKTPVLRPTDKGGGEDPEVGTITSHDGEENHTVDP